jgi:hypothetical protein
MGGFLELIAMILVTISAAQACAPLFDPTRTNQRSLPPPPSPFSEQVNKK